MARRLARQDVSVRPVTGDNRLAALTFLTLRLGFGAPAGLLGLVTVPAGILAALVGLTALYVIANEAAKRRCTSSTGWRPRRCCL